MKSRRLLIAAIAAATLGTSTAWASTTYSELASGSNDLVLTATLTSSALGLNNATVLFNGQSSLLLGITNGSLTVDASATTPPNGALDSFDFPILSATGISISTTATGLLGSLSATNMSLSSSTHTAFSSVVGPQYSFTNVPITDAGQYMFTSTGGSTSSGSFMQPGPLSGTVTQVSTSTIDLAQLNGIEIASFGVGPGGSEGQVQLWLQDSATAKQDIVFTGVSQVLPVPLPGAVWLLGSGLGLLGLWRRRGGAGHRQAAGLDTGTCGVQRR